MTRTILVWTAVFGAVGVALGAFGSHGLAAHFDANPTLEPTFRTASQYHLLHTLALLGTAWASERWPGRWARWAAGAFVVGIVLFSGSLYLLSIFQLRFMGAVAPFGGAALIAGWLCLGAAAWLGEREKEAIKRELR